MNGGEITDNATSQGAAFAAGVTVQSGRRFYNE